MEVAAQGLLAALFGHVAHRTWTGTAYPSLAVGTPDAILLGFLCLMSGVLSGGTALLSSFAPSETSKERANSSRATLPWQVPGHGRISAGIVLLLQVALLTLHLSNSPLEWNVTFWWSTTMTVAHGFSALRAVTSQSRSMTSIIDTVNEVAQVVGIAPMMFTAAAHAVQWTKSMNASSASGTVASGVLDTLYGLASSRRVALQICVMASLLMTYLALTKVIERNFQALRSYMSVFFITFHIFALVGVWRWLTYSPFETFPDGISGRTLNRKRLFIEMFILYFLGGLGITGGAHRLWAHRAYKANLPYRFLMMIFNSIATQGNIYDWSRDHRVHHRYSEKEPDPHNASKGFFHAHMGWLLTKRSPAVIEAVRNCDVSDLLNDPVVVLQKTLDPAWNLSWCFLVPSLYCYFVYNDFWLGFFTLGVLRWISLLHCTWTVNSVAHLWGPRPYNENNGAVESFVTALLAAGEGWHNWHHQYGFDYATSEHGVLRQYNPTKAFIDFFATIGWVWDRKRATRLWEQTKKKRAERQRAALEALSQAKHSDASESTDDTEPTAVDTSSKTTEAASSNSLGGVSLPNFTLTDLIPAGCYRISFRVSSLWLLRDLIAATVVSISCAFIWVGVSHFRHSSPVAAASVGKDIVFTILNCLLFAGYSLAQGTVMMAIWVAAYECAGGRFARSKTLNCIVGVILSFVLCIPYHARRADSLEKVSNNEAKAAKRPKVVDSDGSPGARHLCRALYEDVFSIVNVWRWTSLSRRTVALPVGGFTAVASVTALILAGNRYGWHNIAAWYMGSWLVMNLWLLLYHHLLLTKVHKAFSEQHLSVATPSETAQQSDNKSRTLAEVLGDTAQEDDPADIPETDIYVDPHSIAKMQRQAAALEAAPLTPKTVEFFTREWLLSAIEIFDRTVLLKSSKTTEKGIESPGGAASHVRFVVRLLLFLFGSLHHHLVQVNVLQSVDLSVPHYHAHEAVKALLTHVRAAQKATATAAAMAGSNNSKLTAGATRGRSTSQAMFRAVSQTARFTQHLVDDTPAYITRSTPHVD